MARRGNLPLSMNKKSNIVFCGSHIGGKSILPYLVEHFNVSHVVCLNPEQSKQYNVSGYYDFTSLAKEYGLPVYYPKKYTLTEKEDEEFFLDNKFDLLVQGGWQRLFPPPVLESLSIGALGLHGSSDFLPKGRGRSPLNWSLIEGKKRFFNASVSH